MVCALCTSDAATATAATVAAHRVHCRLDICVVLPRTGAYFVIVEVSIAEKKLVVG